MTPLLEYLQQNRMTLTEMAHQLGWPVNSLHNYAYGHRTPSLRRARQIEVVTKGAVKCADLIQADAA